MEYLYLVLAMIVIGYMIGLLAKNVIWKDDRKNDIMIAIIATVITGLLDWIIIQALNMSTTMLYLGVIFEPPLVALGILWLVRYANKNR